MLTFSTRPGQKWQALLRFAYSRRIMILIYVKQIHWTFHFVGWNVSVDTVIVLHLCCHFGAAETVRQFPSVRVFPGKRVHVTINTILFCVQKNALQPLETWAVGICDQSRSLQDPKIDIGSSLHRKDGAVVPRLQSIAVCCTLRRPRRETQRKCAAIHHEKYRNRLQVYWSLLYVGVVDLVLANDLVQPHVETAWIDFKVFFGPGLTGLDAQTCRGR